MNPEGSPEGPLGAAGFACFSIWSGFHSFYLWKCNNIIKHSEKEAKETGFSGVFEPLKKRCLFIYLAAVGLS